MSGTIAEPLTPYEEDRRKNVERNQKFMESLGLTAVVREFDERVVAKKQQRKPTPEKSLGAHQRSVGLSAPTTRRSSRLVGSKAVVYTELSDRQIRLVDGGPKAKAAASKTLSEGSLRRAAHKPEEYTEEHEKALGGCKGEWVLNDDGYTSGGERVYDTISGKTCHQCRQKTVGYRTWCQKCKSLKGQLCGDCLYMRYGENVLEANANPEWECPVCRDLCNCSICRNRKGWGPTGILYRKVLQRGYQSVAHYLVATHRALPSSTGLVPRLSVSPKRIPEQTRSLTGQPCKTLLNSVVPQAEDENGPKPHKRARTLRSRSSKVVKG